MSSLNTSNASSILKVLYPESLEEVWFPQAPFLAWCPKSYDKIGGSGRQINVVIGGGRGSTTFATAINAKTVPTFATFTVTRKKDYAIGSIDNELIEACKGDRAAIAEAIKTQVDAHTYEFGRSQAFQAWGDGTGARVTQATTGYSGGVVTVTDRRDLVNLELGMVLEQKNSGTINAGTYTVTAIDLDASTFTVTLSGAAAPSDAGTFARQGDFTSGAGNSNCISGVFAWVPTTTSGLSTSFYGVDRSVYPVRLAGGRISGGAKTIEEVLFDAIGRGRTNGGQFDTFWMNSERSSELQKSMQSKAYVDVQSMGKANIGFKGFTLVTSSGPITVMDDPNCKYLYGLLTKRDSWELASLGDYPHFVESDGKKFNRELSSDGIEFRLAGYGNLINKEPVNSMAVLFDS